MCTLVNLIEYILVIYTWILVIYIVLSLLISFGVVNAYNRFVNIVFDAVQRVTEPVLAPIRRFLPNTGALDFSPIVVFIGIWAVRSLLIEYAFGPACGGVPLG